MDCPSCGEPQIIVEADGVELDLCLQGHGLWFDAQEIGMLLGADAAELERELRELPSQGRGRPCPRCSKPMELIGAPGGAGVMLDRCARGHGLWFDDGELEQILQLRLSADLAALAKVADFLSRFRSARKQN
ncbi:MAG: zf-TFIIB domain-containing protein [Planctomycetota bacterium]|nr:zf-TFIIB domain-containing protein [Planctomycetota bacterium]